MAHMWIGDGFSDTDDVLLYIAMDRMKRASSEFFGGGFKYCSPMA